MRAHALRPVLTMISFARLVRYVAVILLFRGFAVAQIPAVEERALLSIPAEVDLAQDFSLRLPVRWEGKAPADLPRIVGNKAWESGAVTDYTTNNSYGLGRELGRLAGFAISVLPGGAWTWNAGDGKARIDHRPEAADQGVADGRWHEVGFVVDRAAGQYLGHPKTVLLADGRTMWRVSPKGHGRGPVMVKKHPAGGRTGSGRCSRC